MYRAAISELQGRSLVHKAYSKEILPPMEGVTPPPGRFDTPTEGGAEGEAGGGGGGGGGGTQSRKGSKSDGIAFPALVK